MTSERKSPPFSYIRVHGDGTATCNQCSQRAEWDPLAFRLAEHEVPGAGRKCNTWDSPRARRCRKCYSWNTKASGELAVHRDAIVEWMDCQDCGGRHPHPVGNSRETIEAAKGIAQRMHDAGANGRQINDRMRSLLGIPVTYGMTNSWFRRNYDRRPVANPLTDKLNAIHRRVASKTDPDMDALEREMEKMLAAIDRDIRGSEKRDRLRNGHRT